MELLRIYANQFVQKTFHLGTSIDQLTGPNAIDIWNDAEHLVSLRMALEELGAVCATAELPITKMKVDYLLKNMDLVADTNNPYRASLIANLPNRMVAHNLYEIRDRLIDELSIKIFFELPHSRKHYFDEPFLGWEGVVKRFENCTRDVEEMNKCFALSRYTAAIFHALQVAEWGAIELGDHIGVTDPKKGWGATSKRLEQLVDGGHTQFPQDLKVSFDFIEQMNREVGCMKLAWRHKVDHAANRLTILPNSDFTPDIAEHILQSVKVFMLRLVDGI